MTRMGVKDVYALRGGWGLWVSQKGEVVTGDKPK
jgi:hypothetical protein